MRARFLGPLFALAILYPADLWAQFEIVATRSAHGYELKLHEGDSSMAVSIDTLEQYLSRQLAPGDSLRAADYAQLDALREFMRSERGSVCSDSASAHIEASTRVQIKRPVLRKHPDK